MRNYRRPLIAVAFTLPILLGCFPDGNEESGVGNTDNQNSESASLGNEAPEVTTAIGAASSNLIFGSATFDTATWK